MRVKIYQINPERDNNRMKFMSLNDSQSPDPSIYDEVFDAEIDENELEEIYGRFNTVGHPLFRGHSLSVSDVVVANGKASICQSIGFRDVSFDTTKTHIPCVIFPLRPIKHSAPITEARKGVVKYSIAALRGKNLIFRKNHQMILRYLI